MDESRAPLLETLVMDGSPRAPDAEEARLLDLWALEYCARTTVWPRGVHIVPGVGYAIFLVEKQEEE